MKDQLKQLILEALQRCYQDGLLSSGILPEIGLEVPARAEHGDFASNLAMVLAREEKKAPRQIAEIFRSAFGDAGGMCSRVEIAGPGFINFFLARQCWYGVLDEVFHQGREYGRSRMGAGLRVQVEFVSANPTGPLHIGHGRGAATGDAVAAVLEAAGYDVQREYYINDAGNQVTLLGRSIWLRLREVRGESVVFPEDGYRGEYIREIARRLAEERGEEIVFLPEEEAVAACGAYGMKTVLSWIEGDLREFGVNSTTGTASAVSMTGTW
jgi:arginyl-tRNA synthetase